MVGAAHRWKEAGCPEGKGNETGVENPQKPSQKETYGLKN